MAESASLRPLARSGNLEIDLNAGDYIVHVRAFSLLPYADSYRHARFVWTAVIIGHKFVLPSFLYLTLSHHTLQDYFQTASKNWDERKLSRVMTERAKSQSIASSMSPDLSVIFQNLFIMPTCPDFKKE